MSKLSRFITDNFLLQSTFAERLYHEQVASLPILDYHNHLSPKKIAKNHQFENITEAWLEGDHYKWRAMRTWGIDESFITGKANARDKFKKWAVTVPNTVRNPLFHWTHLELLRYFNISDLLNEKNADAIFDETDRQLSQSGHRVHGLLSIMKVEVLCTTDDPADSLEYHLLSKKGSTSFKLLPTFRPDKAYAVEDGDAYLSYLEALGEAANINIRSFADLLSALEARINYFNDVGCCLADHGLEAMPIKATRHESPDALFRKVLNRKRLTPQEADHFKYEVLHFLCTCYHRYGWTQQFHLGALRNTNSRMRQWLGPDTGFDSIGDFQQALGLSEFLDQLDTTNQLAKTILYNLNPADNEVLATMAGNFNDGSVKGKVQFGSGWWYLDQKDGMEKQLNTLSNMGLLSCFVGMLTDSRSFLSFPRHEYFRRVLCNLIGQDVANGLLPKDEVWLGKIVQDICYYNAKKYFGF